jgi:hypothetical protein
MSSPAFPTNPYWNRMAIAEYEDFFGRRDELRQMYAFVLQGQSVSVVGERRIGKTSLIRALNFPDFRKWTSTPEEFRFIYIDGSYFANCDEDTFLASVVDQIAEELGFDVPSEIRRESLIKLAKQARGEGFRFSILIDEFDVIAYNSKIAGSPLFAFLRAFSQEYRIAIVLVSKDGSLEPLLRSNQIGSPFWNIYATMYVGPFARTDAEVLVRGPAADCERPFSEDVVAQIFRLAGCHPFFLQIACYHAFAGRTGSDLEHAFSSEAYPHLSYLVRQLPPKQHRELRRWIQSREVHDDRVRADLLRKGVLTQHEGEVEVFSSALPPIILSEQEPDSREARQAAVAMPNSDAPPAPAEAPRNRGISRLLNRRRDE